MFLKTIVVVTRRPVSFERVMRTVAPLSGTGVAVELLVIGSAAGENPDEAECFSRCARMGVRLSTDTHSKCALVQTLNVRQMGTLLDNADLLIPL